MKKLLFFPLFLVMAACGQQQGLPHQNTTPVAGKLALVSPIETDVEPGYFQTFFVDTCVYDPQFDKAFVVFVKKTSLDSLVRVAGPKARNIDVVGLINPYVPDVMTFQQPQDVDDDNTGDGIHYTLGILLHVVYSGR